RSRLRQARSPCAAGVLGISLAPGDIMEDTGIVVSLALIAALLGWIIWRVWSGSKNKKRFFEQLAQLPGAVKGKGDTYTISQGELKIEARYRQGRRRAQFILTAPAVSPVSYQVTSGRKWIKLLKALGRGRGAPTGD